MAGRRTRALVGAVLVVVVGVVAALLLGGSDARETVAAPASARPVAPAAAPAQVGRLRRSLGPQAAVRTDPATGRLQSVARLDGFLTGPSRKPAGEIVRGFIRAHEGAFGIPASALASLDVEQRRVASGGGTAVQHVVMAQDVKGIPVVGADVIANVTDDGRLVNVGGTPTADLHLDALTPSLDGRAALGAARRDVADARPAPAPISTATAPERTTAFAGDDRAALVAWAGDGATRLAWRVLFTDDKSRLWDSLVDAGSGDVLRRNSLSDDANAATVFDHYPGAAVGGTAHAADLTPYLTSGASTLVGPNVRAFSDLDSDNVVDAGEEVDAVSGDFSFTRTGVTWPAGTCPPSPTLCDWTPGTANSWQPNRTEDTTNLFWLVNRFHDHLASAPIDFTASKGAFEGTADRVIAEDMDGAATNGGLADNSHINNANMNTPPKGSNPRMQMYLWRAPFRGVSGGVNAEVIFHEYTHGLSNRLVVDSQGFSTLDERISESMGEAWSDWYAADYLVAKGYATDTAANGEIKGSPYTDGSLNLIRSEPFDCPVGASAPACPGTTQAGAGGYTLGDLGRISGTASTTTDPRPEVHADGEIWVQTLWDLRTKLLALHPATGVDRAELLVTRAMELSLESPSFIDMRDAILQADTLFLGGEDHAAIWQVFAARGMGFFAAQSSSAGYFKPVEDFTQPPAAGGASGTVTGTVTEAGTANPVAGVRVRVGGHDAATSQAYSGLTDAAGHYSIVLPAGTYPNVLTDEGKDFPAQEFGSVTVSDAGVITKDLSLNRNWGAATAGAETFFGQGSNFSDCGPHAINDGDLHSGWAAQNVPATLPTVFIRLPRNIDITKLSIDPSPNCANFGTPGTNGLGNYQIFAGSNSGSLPFATSGSFTAANDGHFNDININLSNVQWIAVRATSAQGPGGTSFVSEFQVYGTPTGSTGAPAVRTDPADAVGSAGATLHGFVTPGGTDATTSFEYAEQGDDQTIAAQPVSSAGGASAISAVLTGLKPGTTYRYRAVATNGAGTTKGSARTFTTSGIAPVVQTGAASGLTGHTATVGGTVLVNNPLNPVLTHFEYGTTDAYGQTSPAAPAPAGSGDQAFSAGLGSLAANTTYHFRAVASDGLRTITGDDATFTTTANTAPTATVVLDKHAPTTAETLTATATRADADSDIASLHYVWKVGATVKRDVTKSAGTAADLTDTFDLSAAGNGERGDVITVEVTPNDGTADGTPVSDSATVGNAPPAATVSLDADTPQTDATLTATATRSDPDGDPVSLHYVWKVGATVKRDVTKSAGTAADLTDTFDLSAAGNGDVGDVVTVTVTPNDGTVDGPAANDSATVSDPPTPTPTVTPTVTPTITPTTTPTVTPTVTVTTTPTVTVSPTVTVTTTPTVTVSPTATVTTTPTVTVSPTVTVTTTPTVTPPSAPTVKVAAGAACARNQKSGTFRLALADADTAAASLTLSATTTKPKLVPASGIKLGGSGVSRTITIKPKAKARGTGAVKVTVSDGTRTASVTITVVAGTAKGQKLKAKGGATLLLGRGGNDKLTGGRGADVLCGGPGNDTLKGGPGADRYSGGPGKDKALGFKPAEGDTKDKT